MYKTEFSVKLENGIEYMCDSQKKTMRTITVKVPTSKLLSDAQVIEAQVRRAERLKVKDSQQMLTTMSEEKIKFMQAEAKKAEKKDEVVDPIDIVNDFIGYELSLSTCSEALKNIMLSPFAKALADGAVPFTDAMYDDMSIIDMKKVLGEYINTFLLKSLK